MSGMNIDGQAPMLGNMEQLQQFIAQQVQQHTTPLQNQVAELNERNQQTELHNQQYGSAAQ